MEKIDKLSYMMYNKVINKNITKEKGELEMKKKILKMIFIIILIIVIIFLINLFRKAIIINEYAKRLDEYQKQTNFYAKFQTDKDIQEMWRKDNIGITKYTSENDIRTIYATSNETWMIFNSKKIAQKFENQNAGAFLPIIEGATLYTDNFGQALQIALKSQITSENINGQDCYKIYIDEDFQVFINKENYLKIKEINSGSTRELIEYSFGTVKDDDVKMPNLDEYEIEEIKE